VARASAKVELLRNVPLFSGLSTKERAELARLLESLAIALGDQAD